MCREGLVVLYIRAEYLRVVGISYERLETLEKVYCTFDLKEYNGVLTHTCRFL